MKFLKNFTIYFIQTFCNLYLLVNQIIYLAYLANREHLKELLKYQLVITSYILKVNKYFFEDVHINCFNQLKVLLIFLELLFYINFYIFHHFHISLNHFTSYILFYIQFYQFHQENYQYQIQDSHHLYELPKSLNHFELNFFLTLQIIVILLFNYFHSLS